MVVLNYELPRTGERPVRVRGRKIAEADGSPTSNRKSRDQFWRWHKIAVYDAAGKWYVAVQFKTNNTPFEQDRYEAWAFASWEEAIGFLEYVYSPLVGTKFPDRPSEEQAADIAKRKAGIIDRWFEAVDEVKRQVEGYKHDVREN